MKFEIAKESAEALYKSASNRHPQWIKDIEELEIRKDQLELALDLIRPFEADEIDDLRIKINLRLRDIVEQIMKIMGRSEVRTSA